MGALFTYDMVHIYECGFVGECDCNAKFLACMCEISCEAFVCVFVCVQDYPSIGQVLFQMETFDVSVIFAVRDTHQNTYEVRDFEEGGSIRFISMPVY